MSEGWKSADPERQRLIMIWCNAHLMNMIYGDLFHKNKSKDECFESMQTLCEFINWFDNHRVPLGLIRKKQKERMLKVIHC